MSKKAQKENDGPEDSGKEEAPLGIEKVDQAIWLNLVDREVLASDRLRQLISRRELSGVSFNLVGLVQAISGLPRYRSDIVELAASGKEVEEIYEIITVKDVRAAADLLLPLYKATGGGEGFVSVDIAPDLSFDTDASAEEASVLWQRIDRPNVLIKVPATQECLPTIQHLVREGVNVHVATLFTVTRYRDVTGAYLAGLLERQTRGMPLARVVSVAAFSLSTIDRFVGAILHMAQKAGQIDSGNAASLRGQVILATAKVAFQNYKEVFSSEAFRQLAPDGARPQRLLWMISNGRDSVSSYLRQMKDLTQLGTIACIPLEAIRSDTVKSGSGSTLEENITDAYQILLLLSQCGSGVDELVDQMEQEVIKEKLLLLDRILSAIAAYCQNQHIKCYP